MSNIAKLAKNGKAVYRWPYEKWSYGWHNFFLDPFTKKKFDERSLVIQVEGNVDCGKQDFSRRLAEKLGMHYVPPIDIEKHFYTSHGYDYRALNPLLPERLRICDYEMFHENPTRHSAIHLFKLIQKMRLLQYIRAIQHLFNTGQGVVMARSVFTDRVLIEAMHNIGWLPRGYVREDGVRFYDWKTRYNYTRNIVLADMLTPHLTIYLDTPVETCLERIRNSDDPMIANSKALVPEFLESIEKSYDTIELPKAENYGHVMKIDYPEKMSDDEILDVARDVESMDFTYNLHDTRFDAWDDETELCWYLARRSEYTSQKAAKWFVRQSAASWWDIAGLGDSITNPDLMLRQILVENHVNDLGYFKDYDSDVRFKNVFNVFFDYINFGDRFWKNIRGSGPM